MRSGVEADQAHLDVDELRIVSQTKYDVSKTNAAPPAA